MKKTFIDPRTLVRTWGTHVLHAVRDLGNPVKRGLCERPEGCEWSSFRHYAIGIEDRLEIESEWATRRSYGSNHLQGDMFLVLASIGKVYLQDVLAFL